MTTSTELATRNLAPPAFVSALSKRALIVGVVCAVIAWVTSFNAPQQLLRGYLMGFMWCLGLTLGSLALVMLGHLTGGNWFMLGRRVMEAATRTLPLMAVMFIPIALGMKSLYTWASADAAMLAHDEVLRAKHGYLNTPFWLLRAVIYFALWLLWAWRLNSGSTRQDTDPRPDVWQGLKAWAAPGILMYALTITLAAVDWMMSLDPHWYSTIYGFIILVGQLLSTYSFCVVMLVWLSKEEPIHGVLFQDRLHDFGKLMLAMTMVWAYFSFSQWLIIWNGNLPEEITWYLARIKGAWGGVAIAVVFLQFALPFVLLLSRDLKRDRRKLVPLAILVIVMRLVDLFWLIVPNPMPGHAHEVMKLSLHPAYIFAPLGVMGIWLAFFGWNLSKRPLLVRNDPQLPRLWEKSHGH
jgi:hypothetical protein